VAVKPPAAKPVVADTPRPPAGPRKVTVTFTLLEPDAKRAAVSGDFNEWSPAGAPMRRHEGGHWETTLELAPGRYQYKFIVDGEWIPDPLARENIQNPHGTLNSVIEVRG
jgi:1,4-alpha-glucan branching enzyme